MQRRTFLSGCAIGLSACGLAIQSVSAKQNGDAPTDTVSRQVVYPWGSDQTVDTGEWIKHRVGWIDVHETSKEDIEAFLDASTVTARIDGDVVDDADRYWSEPYYNEQYDGLTGENEGWFTEWAFVTPPKKPGEHTFSFELSFEERFVDGEHVYPDGLSIPLEATYTVSNPNQGTTRTD